MARPPQHYPTVQPAYTGGWGTWYYYDNGGALANAAADAYLAHLRAIGSNCATVWHHGLNTYAAWAAGRIRNAGMLVGFIGALSEQEHGAVGELKHGTNADMGADATNVYHLGWPYDAGERPYAYCPGYRGTRYVDGMLARWTAYITAVQPDYVQVDDEVWRSPDLAESQLPEDTIDDCTRCLGKTGYAVHHADIAQDLTDLIHAVVPGIPIWFYGTTGYWPSDSGTGPSPEYYYFYSERPADPLGRLAEMIADGLGASWLPYPWPTGKIAHGYPWMSPRTSPLTTEPGPDPEDDDGTVYYTPSMFYDACTMLAEAGAYGFQFWPAPKGIITGTNYSAYWEKKRWQLLHRGVQAFVDHGTPQMNITSSIGHALRITVTIEGGG